ncbi:unnamed protein product, partial [Amoebophrya sp. A120]
PRTTTPSSCFTMPSVKKHEVPRPPVPSSEFHFGRESPSPPPLRTRSYRRRPVYQLQQCLRLEEVQLPQEQMRM